MTNTNNPPLNSNDVVRVTEVRRGRDGNPVERTFHVVITDCEYRNSLPKNRSGWYVSWTEAGYPGESTGSFGTFSLLDGAVKKFGVVRAEKVGVHKKTPVLSLPNLYRNPGYDSVNM